MDEREREQKRLAELPDIRTDPRPGLPGVLLSDEIRKYVEEGKLIRPFCEKRLKPAGYELTVGDQAMKGGEFVRLEGVDSEVKIPPFEVVVVKTAETVSLPRFLIARWNIRVKWAYEGLLWVGGPQVDPGYVGHLFCPLYNLSNETVKLRKGEPIALMDFVKTTGIKDEADLENKNLEKYNRPPKRVLIEDYGIEGFRSALYAHDVDVRDGLQQVRSRLREGLQQVTTKIDVFSSLILGVLAILITAITVPYVAEKSPKVHEEVYEALPFAISVAALLFSVFAWWGASKKGLARWAQLAVVLAIGIAIGWFSVRLGIG